MTFSHQINDNCPNDGATLYSGGYCYECNEWFNPEERE